MAKKKNNESSSSIYKDIKLSGISNKANYCYFNSTIQSLISNNDLRKKFIENHFHHENQKNSNAFKKFIKNYVNGNIVQPYTLIDSLKNDIYLLKDTSQQDAHEFLILFLDILIKENVDENLKLSKFSIVERQKNFLARKFTGYLKYNFICYICKNKAKSSIYEEFRAITIPLEDNIENGVHNIFKNSTFLSKGKCRVCGSIDKIRKNTQILFSPEILIVHILRFTEFKKKNYNKIFINKKFKFDRSNYSLSSIICHSGSMNNGHYISYIRKNDNWVCCDDSSILTDQPPSFESTDVYVAFYNKTS